MILMTEKRFSIHKNELDFYFDVVDSEKRWEIGDVELDNLPVFEDLVDLLNELIEENKQYQQWLGALREELSLADRDNTALEKENKELKKKII